jgi:hypothetical protein
MVEIMVAKNEVDRDAELVLHLTERERYRRGLCNVTADQNCICLDLVQFAQKLPDLRSMEKLEMDIT